MQVVINESYDNMSDEAINKMVENIVDKPVKDANGVVIGFITSAVRNDELKVISMTADIYPDSLSVIEGGIN